ncbi:N-acetylneuraminate synthase [Tannerella sp. oral taxon 808]|nr:N-acetylneuraminate synthase [Tannerella sp. oral taxon 808]
MNKTIIIAEAGVNHNGDIRIAKQLVDAAVMAGADYVKFQTFKTEELVSKNARKAAYQQRNMSSTEDPSQYSMLKKLELSREHHCELVTYCNQKRIKFLSTPFDLSSIEFLASLHLGLWKIPSGEITNYPYLKRIALWHEPVIFSTGMCEMTDIEEAIKVLLRNGLTKEQLIVLHCNTEYPTPMRDVHLHAMKTIADQLGVKVGYSDHTLGIEISIAAVALGACVIEKHFTLDREMDGPDHKASLEPKELAQMVSAIRNVEKALGGTEKKISASEEKNRCIVRKSIVAACDIKKGDVFTEENLTVKRPGDGISPMLWEHVLGKKAKQDFATDDLIVL